MTIRPLTLPMASRDARDLAFRRLVDERLEPSYRLATLLLGDRAAAEDATHDAVVRAWGAFGRLRDPDAFDGWFRRILVNTCRDIQRGRKARPTVPLDLMPPRRGLDVDLATAWAERDALAGALDSLRPEHREIVVLRYYADLSLEDVGRVLSVPLGTVKSRLHHALAYLRAEYDAAARPTREPRR